MIEREMQHLIAFHGDPAETNMFCAVGYIRKSDKPVTIVIWKTQNTLYFWYGDAAEGARESFRYVTSLLFSAATDLTTNVVEDDFTGGL